MAKKLSTRMFTDASNTALPAWWTLFGAAAIALFLGYAGLSAMRGTSAPTPSANTAGYQTGTQPAGTTDTTAPAADVVVNGADGQPVTVPAAAVDVARKAAAGLFSGDFAGIEVKGSPVLGRTFGAPVVGDAVNAAAVTDGFRITFAVDPDGEGAEPRRQTAVVVTGQGTTWAFVAG